MIEYYILMDKVKVKIDERFKGMLWHVEQRGYSYADEYGSQSRHSWTDRDVIYGEFNEIKKLVDLTWSSSAEIEQYDLYKHGIPKEIKDAALEYKKAFVPKSAGDIIEFNNKLYRVTGFYCDGKRYSAVNTNDDNDSIILTKKNKIKMIESAYWKWRRNNF